MNREFPYQIMSKRGRPISLWSVDDCSRSIHILYVGELVSYDEFHAEKKAKIRELNNALTSLRTKREALFRERLVECGLLEPYTRFVLKRGDPSPREASLFDQVVDTSREIALAIGKSQLGTDLTFTEARRNQLQDSFALQTLPACLRKKVSVGTKGSLVYRFEPASSLRSFLELERDFIREGISYSGGNLVKVEDLIHKLGNQDVGYIVHVEVPPGERGNGYSRDLVEVAKWRIQQAGAVPIVYALVSADNVEGRTQMTKTLTSQGFERMAIYPALHGANCNVFVDVRRTLHN